MNADEREALQELIRSGAGLPSTFAEIDAEFQKTKKHFDALNQRRNEINQQLALIADAKAKLAAPADETKLGEPAPLMPAAKPKKSKE